MLCQYKARYCYVNGEWIQLRSLLILAECKWGTSYCKFTVHVMLRYCVVCIDLIGRACCTSMYIVAWLDFTLNVLVTDAKWRVFVGVRSEREGERKKKMLNIYLLFLNPFLGLIWWTILMRCLGILNLYNLFYFSVQSTFLTKYNTSPNTTPISFYQGSCKKRKSK